MNAPNPYETPSALNSDTRRRLRPHRWRTFAIVFAFVFLPSLLLPTIQLMKGNVPIGRLPLWVAYLGLLDTRSVKFALPIVLMHISCSSLLAWLADRLFHRDRTPNTRQPSA